MDDSNRQSEAPRSSEEISIVIPFYNEEHGVGKLSQVLFDELQKINYQVEIVVVDDGSTDDTLSRLKAWQEVDDRVVIVELSRNWGHQNAINAGLDSANGSAIIFMDGDLEDPPEIIPELVEAWEQGFDTVYTVKEYRQQGMFKRCLTGVYYWLVRRTNSHGVEPQAGMYSLVDNIRIGR